MHYVIGDVHGCFEDMTALISKIEDQDPEAAFVFVGDFIDRGDRVPEVLDWCLENITTDGKYQSVRGNHEQMALEWFLHHMDEEDGRRGMEPPGGRLPGAMDPEKRRKVIHFFRSLPYFKTLEIRSAWGRTVTYKVVHAGYSFGIQTEDEARDTWLWDRGDHEIVNDGLGIVVHGHTPTFVTECMDPGPGNLRPGMISYGRYDINVDGGCVYAGVQPYPCMLCAICLETLDEIYPFSIKEQMMRSTRVPMDPEEAEREAAQYTLEFLTAESPRRLEMLKMLGAEV